VLLVLKNSEQPYKLNPLRSIRPTTGIVVAEILVPAAACALLRVLAFEEDLAWFSSNVNKPALVLAVSLLITAA
jgi:hypothetical protein